MSFVVSALLISTVQSTEVFKYSPNNDENYHFKENFSSQLSPVHLVKFKIVLDDEEYDNSVLGSDYAEEANIFFRNGNIEKATESYIKATWSGDEESLNFIETLLNDRKISDIYNKQDHEKLIGYSDLLFKKLKELHK